MLRQLSLYCYDIQTNILFLIVFAVSWFKRLLPTFFSEENRRSSSKPRFCAIACTEMGHGKCEGWLWHKRESRGISFFSWKKYWFILKHSTLYWFSHLNVSTPGSKESLLLKIVLCVSSKCIYFWQIKKMLIIPNVTNKLLMLLLAFKKAVQVV